LEAKPKHTTAWSDAAWGTDHGYYNTHSITKSSFVCSV